MPEKRSLTLAFEFMINKRNTQYLQTWRKEKLFSCAVEPETLFCFLGTLKAVENTIVMCYRTNTLSPITKQRLLNVIRRRYRDFAIILEI